MKKLNSKLFQPLSSNLLRNVRGGDCGDQKTKPSRETSSTTGWVNYDTEIYEQMCTYAYVGDKIEVVSTEWVLVKKIDNYSPK